MIQNTYSLISSKWFIDSSMKNSLLPLLHNVIEGKLIEGTANYPTAYSTKEILAGNKNNTTPASSDNYVAVIPIKGGIYKYNQFCGPTGTKTIGKLIQAYDRDVNCVGIVLDIDSGGGQVSGTPELYDVIAKTNTPIETYTDGYLCSAAYYIASASNKITANKRADKIGSIGTMVYFIDLEGYYKNLGANVIEEYATKSTKKNFDIRELQKGNPEDYIKNELDPITDDFIADVKAKRINVKEEVFTGATYGPIQSKEMGLVDELGDLNGIINRLLQTEKKEDKTMKNTNALTALNAVLAVDSLAVTENGSYLNEEQLGVVNAALTDSTTSIEQLTTSLSEATDQVSAFTQNTAELLAAAGIEDTEDNAKNHTALLDKITALQAKPGNAHTTVKGNEVPPTDGNQSGIDANAGHNQLANSIFN